MNFNIERNRIYAKDNMGKLLAEITYPETSPGVCTIDHTFVDPSLGGQGIAGQLVDMAVARIKEDGKDVQATCSYAVARLQKQILCK